MITAFKNGRREIEVEDGDDLLAMFKAYGYWIRSSKSTEESPLIHVGLEKADEEQWLLFIDEFLKEYNYQIDPSLYDPTKKINMILDVRE